MKDNSKVIVTNRKARHDYAIVETFEAGIALMGTEVKSLREGKANLRDSYASIEDGEVILHGLHISPYSHTSDRDLDPGRDRKLLVRRQEIRRLTGKVKEKGLTLVPLKLYFNERGLAKVELALAKGKHSYDKRQAIAERDAERDLRREMKDKNR
jgi:SsrA-binding protein